MKKIKMTITIDQNNAVGIKFSGSTDELAKCYRALARHIKEQAKVSSLLANAASYVEDRPASRTEPPRS